MELRVLGCSGGIGVNRRTTSFLVDTDILIDAGSGVGDLTLDEMAGIRHVFLTHSHLDHLSFLPLMVDSIFDRIHSPILVHAQPATLKVLKDHIFNWDIWPNFSTLPTADKPVMAYQEMAPGSIIDIAGRFIEMIPVNHIVPAVGYRVESSQGGSFAFSGDTANNNTFWAALNKHDALDLLIVEAAFPNKEEALSKKARHYCSKTLAEDIIQLKHRPPVYLTHTKPGEEETIFAECKQLFGDRDLHQLKAGETFRFK